MSQQVMLMTLRRIFALTLACILLTGAVCSVRAEELAERDKLRRIYIDSVKANLTGQLDNTYIVDSKGNKIPLKKG